MTTTTPTSSSSTRRLMPRLGALSEITLPFHLSWVALSLTVIVLIAAGLRLWNLQSVGDANQYYTAAVKAMLQSPSNFFFVAAEPGGSVTVDKPPLGLWLQALSAMIFGVNGVAVVLPQVIAGILSVPLLFVLVRRYAGPKAGLIAAFVLAVTPVSIAVERNNTMDATLIFTLLVAAWAFIRATDTGKLRWLLLGGVMVGLGFNIKMLQAFLPLPAFYALYFFGAKVGLRRKVMHLALATLVLLTVSFSWATVVQLTPAENRPYIGSSTNNNVFELIFGYNGLNRLLGNSAGPGSAPTGATGATGANITDGASGAFQPPALPPGMTPPANMIGGNGPVGGAGGAGGPGGIGGGFNIGQSGALRLFTTPLANEVGWLLPFGLLSIGLLVISRRIRFPLAENHQVAVLFGGWLLTATVFFSLASFFHPYYLSMLAPPLAALVGVGIVRLWDLAQTRTLRIGLPIVILCGALVGYQLYTAAQYTASVWWAIPTVVLVVVGAALILARRRVARLAAIGFICLFAATLWTPAAWAANTTLYTDASSMLPEAYSGSSSGGFPGAMVSQIGRTTSTMAAYLQANTQGTRYLVAVGSAMQGDSLVLATGRPVLFMGGFSGGDPVVDATKLAQMVQAGEVRYVLSGGMAGPGGSNASVTQWVTANCTAVPASAYTSSATSTAANAANAANAATTGSTNGNPIATLLMGAMNQTTLYDCKVP